MAVLRDAPSSIFPFGYMTLVAVAFGVYLVCTWVYNLYFHPLAGYPGPRIAAASGLYEFYYDVIKGGQYLYKIEEMHRKYGMTNATQPSSGVISCGFAM